ncbi:MAG TPA: hypothetical protein DDZ57_09215 [Porphyromonadaceae bacterium]|jgi:hypothetical protein|nr:hypothetical protein [Porphyromonadaceae bacterium]
MKLGKLFLAGVIALGLMACNKEEVPDLKTGAEATVSVKVFPSSKAPVTRQVGDLSGDGVAPAGLAAESAIKNVEVWLFIGETPDGYKKGNDGEAFVEGIETTAGSKNMVVAANANIGAVANKAALLAQLKNLSQDISTGLVMTSEPVDITLVGGKNQYGFKTDDANYDADAAQQLSLGTRLPITRINARVALVNLTYEFDNPFYDKFELTEVSLFNARKSSKLFGTSLVNGTEFLYGSAYPSTLHSYVGSAGYTGATFTATADATLAETFVPNPDLAAPKLVDPKNAHYFYAFENTADTPENREGTFIVLKGKLFKGDVQYIAPGLATDDEGFTYYAIWVNAAKDGYTYNEGHTADGKIMRNTQYNITATLKKAGNPTIDPPVEAQLDVYVEVAPWIVVTQNVEW